MSAVGFQTGNEYIPVQSISPVQGLGLDWTGGLVPFSTYIYAAVVLRTSVCSSTYICAGVVLRTSVLL